MNIFNNQATTNKNIFASNQSQQTGQTGVVNIFANTNQSASTNVQNQPQQSINIFTQQRQGQQQQQQQQQSQSQSQQQPQQLQNSQNANPPQNIPANPLIQDSLYEKFSFAQIFYKVHNNIKLTIDEIKFVKHGGLLYFKKDSYKQNYFKTVQSKIPNLGFTRKQMIYQGDIPYIPKIDQIFKKIIRNFVFVCQTNEMNGYFMIKEVIRKFKIYAKFYRPKKGLDNKVFELNQMFLSQFYQRSFDGKQTIDMNSNEYKQMLNNLIDRYKQEFMSFLKIVEYVCCINSQTDEDRESRLGSYVDKSNSRNNLQSRRLNNMQQQKRTQGHCRHLKFHDFLETNILSSLFSYYKQFCLALYSDESKIPNEQTSKFKLKFIQIKKQIFFFISRLMGKILIVRYTNQMLMQKDPLPIVEVVKFIDKDFLVTQTNSLNQPEFQEVFINDGLNIILGLMPFGGFLKKKELIGIYYELPEVKEKYTKTLSQQYQKQLLQALSQLKTPMFMPIKLWALTEKEYMYFDHSHYFNNVWSLPGPERQKIDPKKYFVMWQDYLRKNVKVIRILQRSKWSYLFGMVILRLGIQKVMESDFMMSALVEYTKNMVENNVYQFFNMWQGINQLQQSFATRYAKMQQYIKQQSNKQTKQRVVNLSKMVISQFQLFVSGRILQKLFQQNKVQQSYRIVTSLLSEKQERRSYLNQLIYFIDISEDLYLTSMQRDGRERQIQQGPTMLTQSTIMIKFLIAQIVKHYNIPYFKTKSSPASKLIQQSLDEIPENRYAMESFEREIKFLCKMIKTESECGGLQEVETILFEEFRMVDGKFVKLNSYYNHHREYEFIGLKVCVFLCLLLAKICSRQANNVKCLRYIIEAIDTIFCVPSTRQTMLFAFSIVFPLEGSGYVFNHYQNILVNASSNLTDQSVEDSEIRCSLERVIVLLAEGNSLEGEEKRQAEKLHQLLSHHLNHLILYSDSIDTNFPITTDHYQLVNHQPYIAYNKIQKQFKQWQFSTAYQYLGNYEFVLRPSSWLYTLVRLLRFQELLPIDIDSVILLMKKMRIPSVDSPSLHAMNEMLHAINQSNIFEQLLNTLKPTMEKQLTHMKINNELLSNYQPYEYFKVLQIPIGKYHKHENQILVQEKNIKFAINQQGIMIKRICMFVRLVEEVLKIKLQAEFGEYTLLENLQIINQIYTALTDNEQIHRYTIKLAQQSQIIQESINLKAVIVSLLRLYQHEISLADGLKKRKKLFFNQYENLLLNLIQQQVIHEFSHQVQFNDDGFLYLFSKGNQKMLTCYQSQAKFIDSNFFCSVPFISSDFGFDSNQNSLKSSIFSIIQLLCEHKAGPLTVKCLQNYSYPIQNSEFFHTYNPAMKYLKHDRSKSVVPLLFSYINEALSGDDIPPQGWKLYLKARTIETLCVLLKEDLYYREIINSLDRIKGHFLNLLTNQMLSKKGGYPERPQMAQINVYNKIALFSYELIKVTMQKHPNTLGQIIENYLVRPTNLLNILFQRLDDNSKQNCELQKLKIVKSFEPISNYFMQQRLIRLTLYRATLDIMFKIVIDVVEMLRRLDLNDCLKWLFKLGPVVIERSIQLKVDNELISDLNLIPLETMGTSKGHQENIETTNFSQNIREFKYCYRTNMHKYGNNFMYSVFQTFHHLKIHLQHTLGQKPQSKSQKETGWRISPAQYIQLQVYNIQLTNCLKSLRFSYESMTKSYFQLMNMLSNFGRQGQNISCQEMDIQVPKVHEEEIMINKYIIKNRFSFYHGMQCIRGLWMNQTLAEKINKYVGQLQDYAATNSDRAFFDSQMRPNDDANQGIYSRTNAFQHPLPIKTTICINPDHVITLISKLLQMTIDHYYHEDSLKYTQNTKPLRELIRKLLYTLKYKKINCTYRVLLMAYDMILVQHGKLITIEKQKIIKKIQDKKQNKMFLENQNYRINGNQMSLRNLRRGEQKPLHNQEKYERLQHPQLEQIKRQHIDIKQQIIQEVRELLYKRLQTQKPSLYLKKLPTFKQQPSLSTHSNLQKEKNPSFQGQKKGSEQFTYEKEEIMRNVPLACDLCTTVMESIDDLRQCETSQSMMTLFSDETPPSVNFTRIVNYALKLFVENLEQIQNPIARIVLFNLCNKFFFVHENTLAEKWPFYSLQINYCDKLILGNEMNYGTVGTANEDDDPYWLQKINAMDTYCTLAIVNEKLFTKELLTILVNIVQVDEQFIQKQKVIGSTTPKSRKDHFTQSPFEDKNTSRGKRYNLRKYHSNSLTIDKLIEYKKLMTIILLSLIEDNWINPNYSAETNVLFLQVINFVTIEFTLERLLPQRNVQSRLRKLFVFEDPLNGQYGSDWEREEFLRRQQQNRDNQQSLPAQRLSRNELPLAMSHHQMPSFHYLSSSSPTRHFSLFEFIGFVHQNELIYTWMMIVKTGLRNSSIMKEIGGYVLQDQQYDELWHNVVNKIDQLYNFYAGYVEMFIENNNLINNLIKLYNYIAQQPTYMNEFNGLTLFFDPLEEDYVPMQIVKGIIEYCALVIEAVRKCRDIQWKCQRDWERERSNSIRKCLQLLQKNKVIQAFKQLGLFDKDYPHIQKTLNAEMINETNSQKNESKNKFY